MLITLIVLAVLNLLVLGYIAYKMPERVEVENVFTFGDIASPELCREAVAASSRDRAAEVYGAAWPQVKECLERIEEVSAELRRIARR